jgi:cell division protein FtsI/penicillin-binding protein 2
VVVAVAIDFKTGRVLSASGADLGRRVHPGSTVKPLTAIALIEAGASDARECTGDLRVARRRLTCSHPPVTGPIDLPVAIAYSCNQFFAGNALRVDPPALAANLRRFELEVQMPASPEQRALLAIGEWGVLATAVELANAYRRLASIRHKSIVEGMQAASEYGTARLAAPAGVRVAGKTGTSPVPGRLGTLALFAGWAPVEAPRVVVAVMLAGRGGVDAAPAARTVFEKYL